MPRVSRVASGPREPNDAHMPPLSDPEGPRWHARRLLEEANARRMALEGQGLAFFCSPRVLAKYLGFWILEGTGTGDETTTGEQVVYDGWTGNPDQREVGIRVLVLLRLARPSRALVA